MTRPTLVWAAAILCGWAALPAAGGEPKKVELDVAANARLLDTHFARYGYEVSRSITREKSAIRIRLPSATKDVGQTGLYSYVVIAGDFEVSVNYEWISVTPPNGGYGVSCGVAVDMGDDGQKVSVARANLPGKGQGDGYIVTVGTPAETGVKYDNTHYPTKATRGRLVMRREQRELICLSADGDKGELRELTRMPFSTGTVRQLRFYADAGGSPTAVDVRLGQMRFRAEEITGGFPLREQPAGIPWTYIIVGVLIAIAIVLVFVRRRQQREE